MQRKDTERLTAMTQRLCVPIILPYLAMSIGKIYLDSAIKRLRDEKSLGDKAMAQLEEADFHQQPNEASNSIGIIIRHLHGNMLSRWTNFLTEDGEKPWRRRDEEFENNQHSKDQLLLLWEEGWKVFLDTLQSLAEEDLLKTITVRTEPLSVVDAINRQIAHYSYHVGQIVYLARWFRNTRWQSLSIPKGASEQFNQDMKQSRH